MKFLILLNMGVIFFCMNSFAKKTTIQSEKILIGSLNGAPSGILNTAAVKNSSQWHTLLNLGVTLIKNDPHGRIVGDAAMSWDISKDFKTFVFHLRSDIKDSKGNKLDSADWKASFLHLLKSNGSTHSLISDFLPIEGVKTPSATILELHLKKPYQTLLNRLTTPEFILVPKNSIKMGESLDLSVSSGEYYVERLTAEPNECILRANHFHQNHNKDQADKVVIVPQANSNDEAFENLKNNVWQFYISSLLPTDPAYPKFKKYRDSKEINAHFVSPSSIALVILMNSKRLKSDTERRAIAKFLGEQIGNDFASSDVRVTHQLYPLGFVGAVSPSREAEIFKSLQNDNALNTNLIPKNIIGYRSRGAKISGVADWVEQKLLGLGKNIEMNDVDFVNYVGHQDKFDHDFFVMQTGLNSKDPAGSLLYLLGSKDGLIPDPDGSLNKLLNEATQSDPEKRRELLQTISEKLTSTGRIIPLLHYGTAILSPKNIKALPPTDYDDELRLADIRWL
jgi:ABC-type transport system substrate-binding protein